MTTPAPAKSPAFLAKDQPGATAFLLAGFASGLATILLLWFGLTAANQDVRTAMTYGWASTLVIFVLVAMGLAQQKAARKGGA